MTYIVVASLIVITFYLFNKLIIKLIFKSFAREIASHSIGYISGIKYKNFNILNLTLYGIVIETNGTSIKSLKLPYIKFKVRYGQIVIEIAESVFVRGSDYIKLAKFNHTPSFLIRIDSVFNIQLIEGVRVNLYKKNDEKVIDGHIIIKTFKFDSFSRKDTTTNFDLRFAYVKNNINDFIFHINALVFLGASKRTKRNFIKGLQILNFKLAGYSSKVTGSGKLKYHYEANPTGDCDIIIQNPKYISQDFLTEQPKDVIASVDDFLNYMLSKTESNKQKLKFKLLFQNDSLKINSESLSEIRENLNT